MGFSRRSETSNPRRHVSPEHKLISGEPRIFAMKRKAEVDVEEQHVKKKIDVKANGSTQLRDGLLQQADKYHEQYIASEP